MPFERGADRGAVERAGDIKLIGHRQAAGARLVLHDDRGMAGDVVGQDDAPATAH